MYADYDADVAAAQAISVYADDDADVDGPIESVEIHAYMGDATNDEMVQKQKVHVAFVFSALFDTAAVEGHLRGESELSATLNFCPADVLVVDSGTAAEALRIMSKQMSSVGCPTWSDRAAERSSCRLSVYGFSLDSGADNVAAVKHIVASLERVPHVCVLSSWCMLHQYHLIVKSMLIEMDRYVFPGDTEVATYVSGVATIANVWRSPGAARLLKANASKLFDDRIAAMACGRTPGRAIKTRWGSLNSVEAIIIKGFSCLGAIFAAAFGKASKATTPSFGLLSSADEESRERAKAYRTTSVRLLQDRFFMAKVLCSNVSQRPLTHFMNWVQKMHAIEHKRLHDEEVSLSGPAEQMLLQLVTFKAAEIQDEISAQLSQAASDDDGIWGQLWKCIPAEKFKHARALVILLVVHSAAQWKMRIMDRVSSFPLLLLACCSEPYDIDSGRRREIARRFLAAKTCCLKQKLSDISLKFRDRYYGMFVRMAASGKCPLQLWVVVRLMAITIRGDTQKVEGANSTLQTICKQAPNIHLPLVSDRLCLKTGNKMGAASCAQLHTEVKALKDTEEYRERFNNHWHHRRVLPVLADMATPTLQASALSSSSALVPLQPLRELPGAAVLNNFTSSVHLQIQTPPHTIT